MFSLKSFGDEGMDAQNDAPKIKRKKPILGLLVLIFGLIVGYALTISGIFERSMAEKAAPTYSVQMPDIEFVPIPLMVFNLPNGRHLRLGAQIETPVGQSEVVIFLLPRVQDTINDFVSALTLEDIQDDRSLIWIRAQLVRRLQFVLGTEIFHDLMITDFVVD